MTEQTILLLSRLGIALLMLIAGGLAVRLVQNITRKALQKSAWDEVLHAFILNCIRVVMWIVILATVLGYMGVPLSAFLAVVGSAGIAVALALKDSLANFAGGIIILVAKHFKKGDYIEDLSVSGEVQKIDLLYCTLKTLDNKVITIPNGKLANSTVINYSREPVRRVDCDFRISYTDDVQLAKAILENVAKGDARILQDPPFIIGVSSQSAGAIELDMNVWCRTEDVLDVKYFIQEQVRDEFMKAGITVPPPSMNIFLKQ